MLKQSVLAVVGAGFALSAMAIDLSDEQREEIARRLEPVGSVCLQGDSSCVVKAQATAPATGGSSAGDGEDGAAGEDMAAIDGEGVYNQACMACHTTGAGGAPMIGNVDQWSERIAKGRDALHQSGIKGVAGTAMMAKGGRADLSDAQVMAAVDYMIDESQ